MQQHAPGQARGEGLGEGSGKARDPLAGFAEFLHGRGTSGIVDARRRQSYLRVLAAIEINPASLHTGRGPLFLPRLEADQES